MEREDQIRLIAYRIWEEEGYLDGRDVEHWLMAEAIWEKDKKEAVPKDVKARSKPITKRGKKNRPASKRR